MEIGHEHRYAHEHEIVSHDGILAEEVLGAVPVDMTGKQSGPFIPNPGAKK